MSSEAGARAAGWLLLASFPLLMIGAGFWKLSFQAAEPEAALRAIDEQRALWLWIHAWLAIGALVGAAGLASFAHVAAGAGDRVLAPAASALFSIGLALWSAAIVYRVTVVPAIAERAPRGLVPDWFAPAQRGAGLALGTHIALAHVATLLIASSLRRTRLAPRWASHAGFTLALLGFGGLALSPGAFSAPLIGLLFPCLLGIALSRRTRTKSVIH